MTLCLIKQYINEMLAGPPPGLCSPSHSLPFRVCLSNGKWGSLNGKTNCDICFNSGVVNQDCSHIVWKKKTFFSQKHLVILLLLLNTFQRFQCHHLLFNLKNSPPTLPLFDGYTSIMQGCGPKTQHLTKVCFSIKSLPGPLHSLIQQPLMGLLFNARP